LFDFSAGFVTASGWIAAVAAGVLLLRCVRPYLSTLERIAAAFVVLAFSIWAPGPGRLVFPYYPGVVHALALATGAILVVRDPRLSVRAQCTFAGVLGALAFLAKQEIGVAVLIAILASFVLRPREALSRAARTTAVFVIVSCGVLEGILLFSGVDLAALRNPNHFWPLDPVPPEALNSLFRLAAGMSEPAWAFDVRQAAWCLLAQVGLLAAAGLLAARARMRAHWLPVLGLGIALSAWGAIEGFRFSTRAPVALSTSVAFVVAALALVDRRLEKREPIVAIGVFAGLAGLRAVFSPTLSGPFDGTAHFATSLTWLLFLLVIAPRLLAPEPRAAAYARRMTAVLLFLSAGFGAFAGADHLRFSWREPVSSPRGTIFLDSPKAAFYRSLSREIRPGESVLVLPEINAVDVLFRARSVSPLQDHLPGWLDAPLEEEVLGRLEARPPEAIVLFDRSLHEFGVLKFGDRYGERIASWIEKNYSPVLSRRGGSVLRRKSVVGGF
jgi:hypothetical protein